MLSMLTLITSAVIFVVITGRKEKDGNVDIDALVTYDTLMVMPGITTRRKCYMRLHIASWNLPVRQVRGLRL